MGTLEKEILSVMLAMSVVASPLACAPALQRALADDGSYAPAEVREGQVLASGEADAESFESDGDDSTNTGETEIWVRGPERAAQEGEPEDAQRRETSSTASKLPKTSDITGMWLPLAVSLSAMVLLTMGKAMSSRKGGGK